MLVETQDKALRRISELREQCTLEQQAKAHLESALRLEMEEMQCVIKTLTLKLSLVDADDALKNKENNLIQLDNHYETSTAKPETDSLINLVDDLENGNGKNNGDYKLKEISIQLKDANRQIIDLKAREEENTIVLAENKMMIHSELEKKENEVRSLETKLIAAEETIKSMNETKKTLQDVVAKIKQENASLNERITESLEKNKKLEQKVAALDKQLAQIELSKKEVEAKLIIIESEKETLQTKSNQELHKFKADYSELQRKNEELEAISNNKTKETLEKLENELKHVKEAHADMSKQSNEQLEVKKRLELEIGELKTQNDSLFANEASIKEQLDANVKEVIEHQTNKKALEMEISEQKTQINSLLAKEASIKEQFDANVKETHEHQQASQQSLEIEISEQKTRIELLLVNEASIKEQLSVVNSDKAKLEQRLKQLFDEKQHIIGEFEAVKSQNSTYKSENADLQQKIETLGNELKTAKTVGENTESEAIRQLQESMNTRINEFKDKLKAASTSANEKNEQIKNLEQHVKESDREKSDSAADVTNLKSKIDSLKTEKRDLEKTLEKEIRDKSELKTQVTNILQEIGRLEEQLTEVKHSYAEIEKEKQALEEKSEQIVNESKQKVDKDQAQKLENTIKEMEQKLQTVQCENTQLSEKNCSLEEVNGRLQITATEAEISLTSACARVQELENNLASLRVEYDASVATVEKLQTKLAQCLDENSRIFDAKEQLDHEYRSLQDQLELKDKEKMCVLDTNKCQEVELLKLRESTEGMQALEREKNNLAETCDRMHSDLDVLQIENLELKKLRDDMQLKHTTLVAQIDSLNSDRSTVEHELCVLRDTHTETNKSLVDDCEAMLDEVQTLKKQNQQYLSELTTATKERNAVEKKLGAEVNELKNLNQQYLSHLKEATDECATLKKELNKSTDAIKKLEVLEEIKIENEYLNTSVKHLQADLEKAAADRIIFTQQSSELNSKLKSQQCELYVLQEEKEKHSDSDKQKDDELEQLKSICERSQSLNEEFQKEVRQLKDQCDTLRSLSEELQASQSLTDTTLASLKSKVSHTEQLNETYQNEIRKQKVLNEQQLTELQRLTDERTQLTAELKTLKEQLDQHIATTKSLTQEIESSRAIINDLNKDLDLQIESAQRLQPLEKDNEKLQSQIDELIEQQSAAVKAPKVEEFDNLRRVNETLKLELAEQKRISEGKMSNLNHEIDELNENARAYKEKSTEVDFIKQHMTQLQSELNEYKQNDAITATDSDEEVLAVKTERDQLSLQLKKIMNEVQDVSNRNLFLEQECENYLIVKQSNERLKLQNEKLSRQLDDTLVSTVRCMP